MKKYTKEKVKIQCYKKMRKLKKKRDNKRNSKKWNCQKQTKYILSKIGKK